MFYRHHFTFNPIPSAVKHGDRTPHYRYMPSMVFHIFFTLVIIGYDAGSLAAYMKAWRFDTA